MIYVIFNLNILLPLNTGQAAADGGGRLLLRRRAA